MNNEQNGEGDVRSPSLQNLEKGFDSAYRSMSGCKKMLHYTFLIAMPLAILETLWDDLNWNDTLACFCYSLMAWRLGNFQGFFLMMQYCQILAASRTFPGKHLLGDTHSIEEFWTAVYVNLAVNAGRSFYWWFRCNLAPRVPEYLSGLPWYIRPLEWISNVMALVFKNGHYVIYSVSCLGNIRTKWLINHFSRDMSPNAVLPAFCGAFLYDTLALKLPSSGKFSPIPSLANKWACFLGYVGFAFMRLVWLKYSGELSSVSYSWLRYAYLFGEISFFYLSFFGIPRNFHEQVNQSDSDSDSGEAYEKV